MTVTLTLVTLSIIALLLGGIYLELYPGNRHQLSVQRFKSSLALNIAVFIGGMGTLMILGVQDVMAATETAGQAKEISTGLGLALLGIGLPTGLATIGAGIAVSSVGAASLAVITEKPEMFGKTMIYLALAEGIAIYGLVMSILLLGKI